MHTCFSLNWRERWNYVWHSNVTSLVPLAWPNMELYACYVVIQERVKYKPTWCPWACKRWCGHYSRDKKVTFRVWQICNSDPYESKYIWPFIVKWFLNMGYLLLATFVYTMWINYCWATGCKGKDCRNEVGVPHNVRDRWSGTVKTLCYLYAEYPYTFPFLEIPFA